ncbi:NepR family anti-sigma factor [Sediminicoccus sp. BL-A-41-H5]|uniref:NepR family anti-sigma factor n=1 Tax=Sediminicoccus sp. BL-A-41-H5 TaxID=3421106 RepID=UPI003D6788C2
MSAARQKARRTRDAAPDAAFDLWLDRGLNSMFGKVAEEPIPPELIAMIEKSRKGGS